MKEDFAASRLNAWMDAQRKIDPAMATIEKLNAVSAALARWLNFGEPSQKMAKKIGAWMNEIEAMRTDCVAIISKANDYQIKQLARLD